MANKKKTTKKKATRKKATSKKKTTRKKTTRKKKAEPVEEAVDEIEESDETAEETPAPQPVIQEVPTTWMLTDAVYFGLVDWNFERGSVFDVDWDNNKMRCRNTGRRYDNTRDLEIAIGIGKAAPIEEEVANQQINAEVAARQAQLTAQPSPQDVNREHIQRSDADVYDTIDISHTKLAGKKQQDPPKTLEAPTNYVTLRKPRPAKQMEVHHSDGTQESRIVRASNNTDSLYRPMVNNDAPAAPDQHNRGTDNWDTKKSGDVKASISRQMSDTSIKVMPNGQHVIRGMTVVRDDSSPGGGEALNGGFSPVTTTYSPEELAARTEQARSSAATRKKQGGVEHIQEVAPEQQGFVERASPRELVSGQGVADQITDNVNAAQMPQAAPSEKTRKLLGRRR